jgi:hypothetical protein
MKAGALFLSVVLVAAGHVKAQILNPAVTQANIATTICVPGWSATQRPPTSYTNRVKRKLMTQAGIPWSARAEYELDHGVPLVLGGHPSSVHNLHLQPWQGPEGAYAKDAVERRVRAMVCSGQLDLLRAQLCMADDWRTCPGRTREPITEERTE